MEPKRPARKSQLQAYIAVLRALSSVKLDWSQQKLMVDLRKQLKISLEQHMKSLDKVLKDPEVSAIREGLPLPARGGGAPATGAKRERSASPQHRGQQAALPRASAPQEDRRSAKAARRSTQHAGGRGSGLKGGRGGRGGRPGKESSSRGGRIARVAPRDPTPPASMPRQSPPQASEDVHKYVGRKVLVYAKDSTPQWLEAVVTDYNKDTLKNCITYDFNTGHESWHWLNVDKEVKRGVLRWAAGPPIDLQAVVAMATEDGQVEDGKATAPSTGSAGCGYSVAELSAPFESAVLEECLQSATIEELERMREAAVKRQKEAIGELIAMGDALEGADHLVKVLVKCEKLVRSENALKEQVRKMESERQEMRQNNDVLGSRQADARR